MPLVGDKYLCDEPGCNAPVYFDIMDDAPMTPFATHRHKCSGCGHRYGLLRKFKAPEKKRRRRGGRT